MKENVLDVLMYLFENYMDSEEGIDPTQDNLQSELTAAGFDQTEIDKAFNWLEGLADLKGMVPQSPASGPRSSRIYHPEETKKLDQQCQGFLLTLEQLGIVDPVSRELIIDRVMALDTDEIDLEQVKWIVLLVLFNQPGKEAAFAWMENLVFQEDEGTLH